MEEEEKIVREFYTAFQNFDLEKMKAVYHDEAVFSDPAFGTLKQARVRLMWEMLLGAQNGKDFKISFANIHSKGDYVYANWEAWYKFGKKKRPVHNKIQARFRFKDGKVIEHHDTFNLYAWAKQALGFKGLIFGFLPSLKSKLQQNCNYLLRQFESKL